MRDRRCNYQQGISIVTGEAYTAIAFKVQEFGKLFKRAAGDKKSIPNEAAKGNQSYMHGLGTAMLLAG
ncbi:MAG: hypothetical protein KDB27_11145 [Planctomycetales bacterium]|nr:hypothetical protein [Planctomycetales bacterium]